MRPPPKGPAEWNGKTFVDRRVLRVLKELEGNPACEVKSLAGLIDLSTSRLEHLFKQQIGITVSMYRFHLRLRLATNLLETSETSIKAIAYRLGYERPTSFTRFFKVACRVTPTQYRTRYFVAGFASQ